MNLYVIPLNLLIFHQNQQFCLLFKIIWGNFVLTDNWHDSRKIRVLVCNIATPLVRIIQATKEIQGSLISVTTKSQYLEGCKDNFEALSTCMHIAHMSVYSVSQVEHFHIQSVSGCLTNSLKAKICQVSHVTIWHTSGFTQLKNSVGLLYFQFY